MKAWKTLSTKVVFECDGIISIELHTIELPGGEIVADWPWIIAPDFVNVLAMSEDDKFICFRQTKYGIGDISIAPVGGYIEESETPSEAARRELLEETGYEAREVLQLGTYTVDANRGAGQGYFFLAKGCSFVQSIDSDDLEEQELLLLERGEIEAALAAGDFKVIPWVTMVLLALRHLDSTES